MKLYYTPGACSLAPHIVARELDIELEFVRVDLPTKRTEHGEDFNIVNPKGAVPALVLDNGDVLTETAVILTYLDDLRPEAGRTASAGADRYRVQEALNFVATELHKMLGLLFVPNAQQQCKDLVLAILGKRFDYLNVELKRNKFLAGDYSIADAYAFTVLGWTRFLKIDLSPWPQVLSYLSRVKRRPGVQVALVAEGLIETVS